MKRRQFSMLAGAGALAWPAFAQGALPLVALITPGSEIQAAERIVLLRAGLREAGLVEGVNYAFALRFAGGVRERLDGLILELGALKPRVIVSAGIGLVVKQLLPDTPHVFTAIAVDPVKLGLVNSYAHPGGNTTGNVLIAANADKSMTLKRIELFRQLQPNFRRLGFLGTNTVMLAVDELDALRSIARRFGFELVHHPMRTIDDIEPAVAASGQDGVDALYLSGEPLLIANMARVVQAVAASGKPAVATYPDFGRAGILMSYSADLADGFRRAGIYTARILRGEKPGDLPIEQASKFVLIVNAKTAKQLGIHVPPTLLADEVIE
jgi:putative ABC transport system substrate-binding protein